MIYWPEVEALAERRFVEYAAEAARLGVPPWPASSPYYHTTSDHTVGPLYVLTRMWQPRLVVETGVESGRSSHAILGAMAANGRGTLWSVDPCETPFFHADWASATWGHVRKLSQEALPELWSRMISPIDIFIHDSDHGEECQTFEYDQAWEHVRPGGLICSDDWNWAQHGAWEKFCRRHDRAFFRVGAIAAIVR